jgi:hypothetical protein
MGDTNYIAGVVKVLETPRQTITKNNIPVVKFRAQFPQVRNNAMVHVTIWGNLGKGIVGYYNVNDCMLIEGYISLRDKLQASETSSKSKRIEITALRAYPFLLNGQTTND